MHLKRFKLKHELWNNKELTTPNGAHTDYKHKLSSWIQGTKLNRQPTETIKRRFEWYFPNLVSLNDESNEQKWKINLSHSFARWMSQSNYIKYIACWVSEFLHWNDCRGSLLVPLKDNCLISHTQTKWTESVKEWTFVILRKAAHPAQENIWNGLI